MKEYDFILKLNTFQEKERDKNVILSLLCAIIHTLRTKYNLNFDWIQTYYYPYMVNSLLTPKHCSFSFIFTNIFA